MYYSSRYPYIPPRKFASAQMPAPGRVSMRGDVIKSLFRVRLCSPCGKTGHSWMGRARRRMGSNLRFVGVLVFCLTRGRPDCGQQTRRVGSDVVTSNRHVSVTASSIAELIVD